MKKIIEFLQLQFKKFAPTVVLPIVIVLFAIIAADLLYQPKKMFKRGFEIEFSADGKPVALADAANVEALLAAEPELCAQVERGEVGRHEATERLLGRTGPD